jgi:hypothetical protein
MGHGSAALHLINSQGSSIGSTGTRQFQPETSELCVYCDKKLDKATGKELATRVAVAFPEMSPAKAMILIEMMIDESFTEQRARDAVKHVIKQHVAWGKEPPIGAFIQYDRRVKLMTAGELTTLANDGKARWDDYAIVRIDGVSACRSAGNKPVLFARIADIEQYGLTRRDPKTYGQDWPD